jgi:predicted glycosyltransferase
MSGSSLNLKKKWPALSQSGASLSEDGINKLEDRLSAVRKMRRKLEKFIKDAEDDLSVGWESADTAAYAELVQSWAILNAQEADFIERLDLAPGQTPQSTPQVALKQKR